MTPTEWLTLALVLITAYYAWQTRKTVKTMNDTNEANNRPVVSVALTNDSPQGITVINLDILNSGNGLARNIKFTVEGDELKLTETTDKERSLSDVSLLKNGTKALAPRESRRTWLLSSIDRTEELLSKDITVIVKYEKSDYSKKYSDRFSLDFHSLNRMQAGHDSLHSIDKEISKIRTILEKKK